MSQPQQNWGQSLQYRPTLERIARREGQATFEEVIGAMDKLVTLVEKAVLRHQNRWVGCSLIRTHKMQLIHG